MSFASLHPVSLSSRSVASMSCPNPAFSSICNSRLVLMTGGEEEHGARHVEFLYPRNSRSPPHHPFSSSSTVLHGIAVLSFPFFISPIKYNGIIRFPIYIRPIMPRFRDSWPISYYTRNDAASSIAPLSCVPSSKIGENFSLD